MYKSKLQELCHENDWNLPKYDTTKRGPPHNSTFLSSVTVNDYSFYSSAPANSKRKSQNDAAYLAFSYFTSPLDDALLQIEEDITEIKSTLETATKGTEEGLKQLSLEMTNFVEIKSTLETATKGTEKGLKQLGLEMTNFVEMKSRLETVAKWTEEGLKQLSLEMTNFVEIKSRLETVAKGTEKGLKQLSLELTNASAKINRLEMEKVEFVAAVEKVAKIKKFNMKDYIIHVLLCFVVAFLMKSTGGN